MGVAGGAHSESSALSFLPSFPRSPLLGHVVRLHTPAALQRRARRLPPLSDLHAAAVHLDDLGSERLDGSQDQLLMLQGSDAETQHVPETQGKGFKKEKKS